MAASKPYVVPAADQSEKSFFVPLSDGRIEVSLPLERNLVEPVLRRVALWLNFPGAKSATKAALIAGIQQNLSLRPTSEAVERWPELGRRANSPIAQRAWMKRAGYKLLKRVEAETPEFVPHVRVKILEIEAAQRTAESEKVRRDAAEAAREARDNAPPAWLDAALDEKPEGAHYRIQVLEETQGHDGYCTGLEEEDLVIESSQTKTLYLPLLPSLALPAALNEKGKWSRHSGHHCCCGAREISTLMSWEKCE